MANQAGKNFEWAGRKISQTCKNTPADCATVGLTHLQIILDKTHRSNKSHESTNMSQQGEEGMLMNKLLCLIVSVTMTVFSSAAQSAFKMIDGKIYSITDSSVWTVFYDHLKVIGYSEDGFICESYKTETHAAGGSSTHDANPRYIPNNITTIIRGQKLILKNYRSQTPVALENDISPPVNAIRTGQRSITRSGGSWTTDSANSGSGYTVSEIVYVYDMGLDYYPPPRVLTPEEQNAAGKKHAEQEKKTVAWLFSQATNHVPSAESSLGFRYLKGQGVPKDEALGRQWLQKAAADGDDEAAAKLASLAAAQTNSEPASSISSTNSELKSTQSPWP